MNDYDFLKLLVDKKVADSFQFFNSCQYKLSSADLSYRILEKLVVKYQQDEKQALAKVYADAQKNGKGTYINKENVVNILGIEINTTVAIEKLVSEIMGILHSFFDIFSQWINTCLFAEKALSIENVDLYKVIKRLKKFPEYTGDFIDEFKKIIESDTYKYVVDYNNKQKHQRQLFIKNNYDILKNQGSIISSEFQKKGKSHIEKNILYVISDTLDYCKRIFLKSREYIIDLYIHTNCKYTEHRFYNPKTYLYFETDEDFYRMRNAKEHYCYIEVDPMTILPEYHIMLMFDPTNVEDDDDRPIQLENSDYPIIMLKDRNSDKIVGILKPEDNNTISYSDCDDIMYRKYKSITTDYLYEMHNAIYVDKYTYKPKFSELTKSVAKEC